MGWVKNTAAAILFSAAALFAKEAGAQYVEEQPAVGTYPTLSCEGVYPNPAIYCRLESFAYPTLSIDKYGAFIPGVQVSVDFSGSRLIAGRYGFGESFENGRNCVTNNFENNSEQGWMVGMSAPNNDRICFGGMGGVRPGMSIPAFGPGAEQGFYFDLGALYTIRHSSRELAYLGLMLRFPSLTFSLGTEYRFLTRAGEFTVSGNIEMPVMHFKPGGGAGVDWKLTGGRMEGWIFSLGAGRHSLSSIYARVWWDNWTIWPTTEINACARKELPWGTAKASARANFGSDNMFGTARDNSGLSLEAGVVLKLKQPLRIFKGNRQQKAMMNIR